MSKDKDEKDEKDEGPELRRHGKLTLAGMKETIKGGGGVMYQGMIITKEGDLPDEAELVEGDTAAAEAASQALQAQIGALSAQVAAIERAKTSTSKAGTAAAEEKHVTPKR